MTSFDCCRVHTWVHTEGHRERAAGGAQGRGVYALAREFASQPWEAAGSAISFSMGIGPRAGKVNQAGP
jgi:hypothetical protein